MCFLEGSSSVLRGLPLEVWLWAASAAVLPCVGSLHSLSWVPSALGWLWLLALFLTGFSQALQLSQCLCDRVPVLNPPYELPNMGPVFLTGS